MFKWAGRTLAACVVLAAVPASAQSNLSGVWNNLGILNEDWPDRLPGPELGDYAGLPVNDAVRARADTWDASLITLPEYQCRVHPSDYVPSFAGLRIWEERDSASQQLVAIHTHHFAWGTERTIWMDGRPHPPEYALHTAMGFSTGQVGRRHPDRHDDAPEGRMDAPQRPAAQRLGDGDRTLHPPRRHA